MEGICLQFYVNEFQKHHGKLVYEWLLEFAKKNGIPGGSVFKAIAGYGRDGKLHEEHFFELASEVPVKVTFFLSKEESEKFISLVAQELPNLFYSLFSSEFGILNQTSHS